MCNSTSTVNVSMAGNTIMAVAHKIFRKKSWEELCEEINEFLNGLSSEDVISVSHVSEPPYAVGIVWYTTAEE